jgi:hypothetical protein
MPNIVDRSFQAKCSFFIRLLSAGKQNKSNENKSNEILILKVIEHGAIKK